LTGQGALDPAIVCPQLFTSLAPAAHKLCTSISSCRSRLPTQSKQALTTMVSNLMVVVFSNEAACVTHNTAGLALGGDAGSLPVCGPYPDGLASKNDLERSRLNRLSGVSHPKDVQ
jgi:hypothetical protein